MRNILLAILAAALMFSTGCGERGETVSGEAYFPEEKRIALTFDDGPRRETTEALLDALQAQGVPATFFLIGEQLEGCEDLVRRMKEEGHQVGNHSWSHARLTACTPEEARREITRTDDALTAILGEGEYWFRPPYGLLEGREGLDVPVVRWSIDPRDWECRNADTVTERVLRAAEPGAVILLHDIYPSSVEAAQRVIKALRAEGYQFVTVRELGA